VAPDVYIFRVVSSLSCCSSDSFLLFSQCRSFSSSHSSLQRSIHRFTLLSFACCRMIYFSDPSHRRFGSLLFPMESFFFSFSVYHFHSRIFMCLEIAVGLIGPRSRVHESILLPSSDI
jgi:hypothetical protein